MNIPDTLKPLTVPVDGLKPYGKNPRKGDVGVIAESLAAHGQYRPIVVRSSTNEVLAGNHTLAAAKQLGWLEIAATFIDVTDDEAARIVLVDNRAADLGAYDETALAGLLSDLAVTGKALIGTGYTDADLLLLTTDDADDDDSEESQYTRRMDSVQYEPTGDCPETVSLVGRTKTDTLIEQIDKTELPADVRAFLIAGAQRHLVFDYAKIAEFYAHADPDVQALMEASALVIIDYEDAALHGFVRLSTRLEKLLQEDLTARAIEDARTGRANVNA